ncbi:MAG: RNA pyrophosphohydrolase [Rhodothalassiaceae bacterium]
MREKSTDLPYRPCVGMMLFNRDGLVWTGRRRDTPVEAWQMPQGGVDPGEDLETAARRELREEIGTDAVRILARLPEPLCYDLPPELLGRVWGGRYRGQCQHWFAMRFLGRDSDIELDQGEREFVAWRWTPVDDLPRLIVPFKRDVYERVVAAFRHLAVPDRGS